MRRWSFAVTALLALLSPLTLAQALPQEDGWHRWSVTRLASASTGCCYRNDRLTACSLERGRDGYSFHLEQGDAASDILVHARVEGGKLVQLLAVGAQCPVDSGQLSVRELGSIDADRSAEWLGRQLSAGARINEQIYMALAAHDGARADALLRQAVAPGQPRRDRQQALFWIGQSREQAAAELLLSALGDADADFREHAAFVVAQTELPAAFDALVRQGRDDAVAQVRSQAWFWLAQQGREGAEAALLAAMAEERESRVREQIVFALSQLPDERGSQALIALLSRPQAQREVRKQALFWLAQSEDEAAWRYLDGVLR